MIARLFPAALRGEVTAPPSKSDAQRLLIAAWLAGDIDRVQLNLSLIHISEPTRP